MKIFRGAKPLKPHLVAPMLCTVNKTFVKHNVSSVFKKI